MSQLYLLKTGKLPELDLMLQSAKDVASNPKLFSHISNLGLKDFHLRINSLSIDELVVQVMTTDGLEYLPLLCTRAKSVRIFLDPSDVSPVTVNVICKIYPDKAPEIRRAMMTRKSITEVLYG